MVDRDNLAGQYARVGRPVLLIEESLSQDTGWNVYGGGKG